MSGLSFEIHPDAILEAWEARQWYAQRSPQAAVAFVDELDRAQREVAAAPDSWPVYLFGTRRFLFRRFPYMLVYSFRPDRIVLIAVAHAKRRPGYWKDRQ